MYAIHCILYIVHTKLYNKHFKLYILPCTLYNIDTVCTLLLYRTHTCHIDYTFKGFRFPLRNTLPPCQFCQCNDREVGRCTAIGPNTMCTELCWTVFKVYRKLYTLHYTPDTVHCTSVTVRCKLCAKQLTLYKVYITLNMYCSDLMSIKSPGKILYLNHIEILGLFDPKSSLCVPLTSPSEVRL